MVTNNELAAQFDLFAEILQLKGDIRFKIIAYERAAQAIRSHGQPLFDLYKSGGIKELEKIDGIGSGVATKIGEYIDMGKMKELEVLKKEFPRVETDLLGLPGIGPKTAEKLVKELKVKSVSELKSVLAEKGSKYFKQKTLANIAKSVDVAKSLGGRMLLYEVKSIVDAIVEYLKKSKDASQVEAVGSFRRLRETVGDIDIIASSPNPKAVIEHFNKYPDFKKILMTGETKSSAIHEAGLRVDFEILPEDEFGSLLQHFTGSKEHNVALRTYAQTKGMSVSEHGIKIAARGNKIVKCATEKEVYKTLGMDFIPPELREDRGEIKAALTHKLPKLVELDQIKGDLHVHSNYSDGRNTIEEMVTTAEKLGYEYVAISDHTVSLGVARGLDGKRFIERKGEIDRVQAKHPKIKILDSCEVNIMSDGSLDLADEVMARFDIVTASIHSGLTQSKEQITKRLMQAITNQHVDIIGHPTGRILNQREGYTADWPAIFKACADHSVALEISAFPDRLDLTDALVLEAKKAGVKFAICTDSHMVQHLSYMDYGLSVARRGWCEKQDILNCRNLKDLLDYFRN